MKVLIVSDGFSSNLYSDSFTQPFEEFGHEVSHFYWKGYFKNYQYPNHLTPSHDSKIKSLYYRFQNKFTFGPVINQINKDLIKHTTEFQPDLVFIYRGTHLFGKTIRSIRKNGCRVFSYNNDDPFSPNYPKYYWRLHKEIVKECDVVYAYRLANINDYRNIGVENVKLLRSYYVSSSNFCIPGVVKDIDIVFIGHFENDGRDSLMLSLFESEYNVKLFGTGWEKSPFYNEIVKLNGPIKPVYKDYNLTINRSKIALVFLSKLNRDTYTRRCFEIPSTKTMMLSEYSEDLSSLFEPNVEAFFFKNKTEFENKIDYLLNNKEVIERVSLSGYKRIIHDGHEVKDRVRAIINDFNQLPQIDKGTFNG
ncbi:TPA: glycosyltransferase [Vibrio parahaemolyticus]|uniref:Spore protein YkvP/CgeB glycosyl transferase-like domain-containing protein n=1 Tax=Vibrio parahaemolyticus TaxID=670 RepID=A0A7M1WPK4_VIBPH|nr:glycosyltransferase [Vibrio parahaemolyticus]QOS29017.1 hypothetical protein VP386_00012 [Vibrio parahaemolyticus]HCM0859445.1 glycosyltransferase family 1 protein [Vibrio parahaemolyticus]